MNVQHINMSERTNLKSYITYIQAQSALCGGYIILQSPVVCTKCGVLESWQALSNDFSLSDNQLICFILIWNTITAPENSRP